MAPGDLVQYKKYTGRIKYVFAETCIVTLYNYMGYKEIDRKCNINELTKCYEQMSL